MIWKLVHYFLVGWALIFFAGVGMSQVPASYWFDPGDVLISDDQLVTFDREIHRESLIFYSVIVRQVGTNQVVVDASGGPFTYRPDATLPEEITLSWWAGEDVDLPPGQYIAETCWTVFAPFYGLAPPKTVCRQSNVFDVEER